MIDFVFFGLSHPTELPLKVKLQERGVDAGAR